MFVYDLYAAAFIMRSGTSSVIYPASTTKLLTALTALSILDPETVVEAGEEVRLIKEHSSIAYILPGHKLSVEMLIEAMLLPSGNDAAYVLAAACGKKLSADDGMQPQKAVDTFVSEMNAYAKISAAARRTLRLPTVSAAASTTRLSRIWQRYRQRRHRTG